MSIEECQSPRPGFPKPVPDTPVNVMEQFSMKGKVIIVTGAAEGIGGAVADAMAEAGGNVALWYNSYVDLPQYASSFLFPLPKHVINTY
jgi:sorbose reductase